SATSETGPGAVHALRLVDRALKEAGLEPNDIQCLAIGLGPGSYTGIRSAIALAQGWQLARPVKLLGISSVECLAARAHANGTRGRVQIVIDAQRDEFYVAAYEIGNVDWKLVEPLHLSHPEQISAASPADGSIIGPDACPGFAGGRMVFPEAGFLGRLAAGRRDFVSGFELEPIYPREAAFIKAPPPRILPP
ncbi:MAG: tRNA (adenosine(37)-N6)-threonylcarbamoyltransferase complex dimerization subunit type 1 TsaB, partial [Candidatus Omnitrophica bacterium]|nr:tRNA (adenosine(37)-N6)-threonylcarbamoyltransferase complex dimerization subunit type 1 TsaB [Candidatus Omnitrophota bacterium]